MLIMSSKICMRHFHRRRSRPTQRAADPASCRSQAPVVTAGERVGDERLTPRPLDKVKLKLTRLRTRRARLTARRGPGRRDFSPAPPGSLTKSQVSEGYGASNTGNQRMGTYNHLTEKLQITAGEHEYELLFEAAI